jgi:phage terminase large subunit GpA-like protein
MSVTEWANKHFYLSAESSYVEGDWETMPYQVAPLNSMGNDDIRVVNLVKSARVGYTKMILAFIAYSIEHKKRNGIVWQPTDDARSDFTKQHVEPMIRDVRCMRNIFPYIDKKSKFNTLDYKAFSNSRQLFLKGGKSAKNFREKSVDFGIYDELSSFDPDIEREGDAVTLGDVRMSGSSFPKSIRGSTPKEAGTCQISKAANDADEHFRRYFPCPHCSEKQLLRWGGPDANFGIKYTNDDPETAQYLCEHCGALIDNDSMPEMDRNAVWISDNGMTTLDGESFYGPHGELVSAPKSVTYYMWAAFCSPGGKNWREIVEDFLNAKKDPTKLKVWVNTSLGEVWEEESDRVEPHQLYMRREHYPNGKVPAKCGLLLWGGDTQDDRIEVSVWGFGVARESWLIAHEIFYGDPGRPELWNRVEEYLTTTSWEHESGAMLRVRGGGLDTGGHYTSMAYKFCKRNQGRNWLALKGSNQLEAPLTSRPSRNNSERVRLFSIGTTEAKDLIYGCLKIQEPGPGYVHFPVSTDEETYSADEEYFEQLTAEKKVTEFKSGRPVRRYKAQRPRVEALDCYVYAVAAFEILKMNVQSILNELRAPQSDREKPATKNKSRRGVTRNRDGGWMDRYR